MERTREDYAEIMAALDGFKGKRMNLSFVFEDGTIGNLETMNSHQSAVWTERYTVIRTAKSLPKVLPLSHPAVCGGSQVTVWDTGYQIKVDSNIMTATILEP